MKKQIADFLGELAEEMGWSPEPGEPRITQPTSKPARPVAPATDRVQSAAPPPLAAPAAPTANAPSTAPAGRAPSQFEARTHRMDLIETQVKQLRRTVEHLASEITNLRTEMARLRHMPAPPDAAAGADREADDIATTPSVTSLLERVTSERETDDASPGETPPATPETQSTSPLSMFPAEPRDPTEPSRLDLFR